MFIKSIIKKKGKKKYKMSNLKLKRFNLKKIYQRTFLIILFKKL